LYIWRREIKATHLRKNLFSVLKRAAQTGKPVEIESKGQKFQIIAIKRQEKFAGLQKHSEDLSPLITKDSRIHEHYPKAVW
jgi:prevent-host-death family protein